MFLINRSSKTLKTLTFTCKDVAFDLSHSTQKRSYVDVYMKWKRDQFYESIEHIHRSAQLKSVIALKNCIAQDPNGCIPISSVSKRGREFDVPIKVAMFLRKFPAIFEEFTGPNYNLPWFRLTPEAAELDRKERGVYQNSVDGLRDRLKRLILMSKDKVLPLSIVHGMKWNLGLPDDFLQYPEINLDSSFRFVDLEDGSKGLGVKINGERVLSVLQRNARKRGLCSGELDEAVEFPLFPSKGVRLRRKIEDWLKEFQELPYVSPYDDYSNLDPSSDVAEKRVVGFLHELLCLFVEHSAERRKLLCLKKCFGLPQKFHKAFERHPHIFYLSLRNKTCTGILKEAYKDRSSVENHPVLAVRKEYIHLMKASEAILKSRRISNACRFEGSVEKDLDLEFDDGERNASRV
ncbi:PREDICTED: protein ROOT PRIMORDIUM DEFECTIVE 1 [Tarenaya hassleriana]|uniref:protein ROOT PRIMORDIUM DEFECTIVE 1 n=1 Tax=Tarenaya hassleriana TaxID=28532 RepID=UPI00053CA2E2|nr:PREDICTED: protein ROOT PRIMORDIUM DEFECTIVE 1 [Tarenaya hassleriana]XP_010555814.1 PREDICTED: protein ROOT PRIMORDIUM DEFECTIVE 1 [Tarenaya hassleriana]